MKNLQTKKYYLLIKVYQQNKLDLKTFKNQIKTIEEKEKPHAFNIHKCGQKSIQD